MTQYCSESSPNEGTVKSDGHEAKGHTGTSGLESHEPLTQGLAYIRDETAPAALIHPGEPREP